MCLTSSSRYHPVMSSNDPSSSVPSSNTAPIPDSKLLPSVQRTEANEQDEMSPSTSLNVEPSTEKTTFVISDSDLQLNEQSIVPSASDTPLANRGEVTSLDAISFEEELVGELKREAKSAFEITDIRPNPDELDKSMISRHPVSMESLQVTKGESGGSDESMTAVVANEKQHAVGNEGERLQQQQDQATFVIGGEDSNSVEAPLEALEDAASSSQGGGSSNVTSSPKLLVADDPTAGKMSPHPSGSTSVPPSANGSSVQPNRFRKVNRYERGRWTVRDSLVTEESAVQKQQETSSEVGASNDTPPPPTKPAHHQPQHQRSDSTNTESTLMEQGTLQNVGVGTLVVGGGGVGMGGMSLPSGADSTSDKDSSSVHMDRNSTAADTLSLSCNTSMSSIIATEKSIDGDEILADIDTESVGGGGGGGGQTQNLTSQEGEATVAATAAAVAAAVEATATMTGSEVPVASNHPPVISTSSLGSVPLPSASSTTVSRDEQLSMPTTSSSNQASGLDNVRIRRVEDAMSMLQNELKHILTSSSYPVMMEENRALKDQQSQMDQENVKLRQELIDTKDRLRATEDENQRLSKELKELRNSLSALAQPTTPTPVPPPSIASTTTIASSSTASSTAVTATQAGRLSQTSTNAPPEAGHHTNTTTNPAPHHAPLHASSSPVSSELATPSFSPLVTPAPSISKDSNFTPQDGT